MNSKLLRLATVLAFLGIAGVAQATYHNFACNWKSVFVRQAAGVAQVGYVTRFEGLDLPAPLAADLDVAMPYRSTTALTYQAVAPVNGQVHVVGVLENWSWAGGVGDPICFSMYVSPANAHLLKSALATGLKSSAIRQLGFWIGKHDEESRQWFEEAYPAAATISAQLNAHGPMDVRLHVADVSTRVAPTIDIPLYQVYFEIVPAANTMVRLNMASSPTAKVTVGWGLVVGTLAR